VTVMVSLVLQGIAAVIAAAAFSYLIVAIVVPERF